MRLTRMLRTRATTPGFRPPQRWRGVDFPVVTTRAVRATTDARGRVGYRSVVCQRAYLKKMYLAGLEQKAGEICMIRRIQCTVAKFNKDTHLKCGGACVDGGLPSRQL